MMGPLLRVLVLPAGCLALALLPGCGPKATIRTLPADAVVVAFGDSLTRGTGAEAGEDYPAVLARLSGRRVVNAGVAGERSAAGLRRLPAVIEEHRPALVILCHGGNDILDGAADEAIAANLSAMIELLRGEGVDVVLLGVPQKGLLLRSPAFYAEVAKRHGLPYDGTAIPDILSKGALKSDYIHPNARGYAKLAEAVRALIDRAQR